MVIGHCAPVGQKKFVILHCWRIIHHLLHKTIESSRKDLPTINQRHTQDFEQVKCQKSPYFK